MLDKPSIILITGIMASGKSSVAQQVAESLPKSVHLRGDVFRRMVINGRQEMGADYSQEAFAQLLMRYRAAAAAAQVYCEAGFTVVYQDVILGDVLTKVIEMLGTTYSRYVVVLCPSADVVAQREAERDKTGYGSWTPEMLDHELRVNTPKIGLWLDSSTLTVDDTANALLKRLDEAAL